MIGAQKEHGCRDSDADHSSATEQRSSHGNGRSDAFDAFAKETRKCGADDGRDRHGPDVDNAISHRVDTVGSIHAEMREHNLIDIVVDRGGRSGDGKDEAFCRNA